MAVATSAPQLSRSIGAPVGLAILGTLLSQGMASSMAKYLPPAALAKLEASGGGATATAVFDPSQLARLPPAIELGIRHGLADALHPVFLARVPIIAVAFIATLFIKELPLRQTVHVTAGRPTDSWRLGLLASCFGRARRTECPLVDQVSRSDRLVWSFWLAAGIAFIGGLWPLGFGGTANRGAMAVLPSTAGAGAAAACGLLSRHGAQ